MPCHSDSEHHIHFQSPTKDDNSVPFGRAYWCMENAGLLAAVTKASRTNCGGAHEGKPWPRFTDWRHEQDKNVRAISMQFDQYLGFQRKCRKLREDRRSNAFQPLRTQHILAVRIQIGDTKWTPSSPAPVWRMSDSREMDKTCEKRFVHKLSCQHAIDVPKMPFYLSHVYECFCDFSHVSGSSPLGHPYSAILGYLERANECCCVNEL